MQCDLIHVTPDRLNATLKQAQAMFASPGDHEVTLSFAEGMYTLDAPVSWDAAGFPGKARLRMIGEGGEVVFSSLNEITVERFAKVPGKPYYVCQLAPLAEGGYPVLRSLYVNGKLIDISRTKEYRSTPRFTQEGATYELRQKDFNDTHKLYVPLAAIDEVGLANCPGAELHIRVEWEFKIYHISRIDLEDDWTDEAGDVHVAMHIDENELQAGNGSLPMYSRVFYICNSTACLTTPGQYAYEQAQGLLYYYPAGDIGACRFELGVATNLFAFSNFDALTLHGLTFTGLEDVLMTEIGYYAPGQSGRWSALSGLEELPAFYRAGAVFIDNVHEMDVDRCVFRELPCDALAMVGLLSNVTIRNSRFEHIGASGIRMGRPIACIAHDRIENVQIVNNYLDNIGFTYENSSSILLTKVRNAKINHNTILRSSYSAVSLGWRWEVARWAYGEEVNLDNVEVAYNFIRSFVMNMRDGGGIYTLGGNVWVDHAAFMNTLHDNYVVEDELTCPENGFFASLYHDGASSNWHTYNNVVIHNPALNGTTDSYSARIYLQCAWEEGAGTASVMGQCTWHILCENNYICCCKDFGEVYRSQAVDPEKASDMLDASRDLREKDTHLLATADELKNYPMAMRVVQFSGCDETVGEGEK